MQKLHNVQKIDFDGAFMVLHVDGQHYRVDLRKVSPLLASANDSSRRFHKVSPSGFGIHWPQLDEDLTIDGLIKAGRSVYPESSNVADVLRENDSKNL